MILFQVAVSMRGLFVCGCWGKVERAHATLCKYVAFTGLIRAPSVGLQERRGLMLCNDGTCE